ncbi:hypothetical protein AOLI_G00210490 [Acnodon oligacanthus]
MIDSTPPVTMASYHQETILALPLLTTTSQYCPQVSVVSVQLWKRLIPGRDCSDDQRLHHVQVDTAIRARKGKAEARLQCLDVSVVPCQNLKYTAFENDKHVFCGVNLPNQPMIDSCAGDSGGGLLLTGKADVVFGVLIGGRRGGCGGQIVFTDVCEYRVWIKDAMTSETE